MEKIVIKIDCGETTCWNCRFYKEPLREDPYCELFFKHVVGDRLPECLNAEVKE